MSQSETGSNGRDRIAPHDVQRAFISLSPSRLARKIIGFNLIALVVLVVGVLILNPFRDSLVTQREAELVATAELIADVFEQTDPDDPLYSTAEQILGGLDLAPGIEVYVFATDGAILATTEGKFRATAESLRGLQTQPASTVLTDFLNTVWQLLSARFGQDSKPSPSDSGEDEARRLLDAALGGVTQLRNGIDDAGAYTFSVATAIQDKADTRGVIALTTVAGQIDQLMRNEREQILRLFVIAILVSIGLSLVLASAIANPLSDLAQAAELGGDRLTGPGRVPIPDMTARPDEIGRLSGAMRGMVSALYERIDANEQFAADVAHEIKNPLASLRSAVGTLRGARDDTQRTRLLDVIEHDVRRMDRLVSEISNASRLDSELVKDEEEPFDLILMLDGLSAYLGAQAEESGLEFIRDLPTEPVIIQGLEARLAQVFVNMISNAMSFCEEGDAIRIWARCREDRVLVVVEDTGPGIPDEALGKIFNRFYSERPEQEFGNHSGLGLAISRQIVEAHGGVIWAENIRPTDADITSEPLGARFVVGLPL